MIAFIRGVRTAVKTVRMSASARSSSKSAFRTYRRELLDRTLICNQRHLLHALRQFEQHSNEHRPHRAIHQAAPLREVPDPIIDPDELQQLRIRRHDRLGDTIHEYRHAA
ncbi:hypothetical protein GCM10023205_67230 [Yinghuangia aomiensis]|uniref:Integrase catalytic domain-containing protein n=2 Tax=Yinghuangia aomiensis TaxID=676205 RepID=A0ABP9I4T8_9ACTN